MFNAVFGEKIFCGLDLGSARFKASALKLRRGADFEFLGVHECPAGGFKNSSPTNLNDFVEAIQSTLGGLMKKTGVRLKNLQVGLGGDLIGNRLSQAVIPLIEKGSKVITLGDVQKVVREARLLGLKIEEELLHEFPQSYQIDGINRASNPLGLYGRKLEVELLLIAAHATPLTNIMKAVHQAGYEAANLYWTSYAASWTSLTPKIKTGGGALVDVGSSTTDVLIFKAGILRHTQKIPLGGESVTNRMAQNLGLTFDVAEAMKKNYNVVLNGDQRKEEDILIKNERGYLPLKRQAIDESLEPAIEELVSHIEKVIKGPFYHQLNGGLIMVGGGSLLSGFLEMIERATSLPVGMGTIQIPHTALNPAVFSPAVGLAMLGSQKVLSFVADTPPAHWLENLRDRLKELYQDYF